MFWKRNRVARSASLARGKREKEERSLSEEGRCTQRRPHFPFQREHRMQPAKALGRTEGPWKRWPEPNTVDKKAGALPPQEEAAFGESAEQERIRWRGWQRQRGGLPRSTEGKEPRD